MLIQLDAQLPSYPGYSYSINFRLLPRKAPICPIKQEHNGEPKPIRTTLRHSQCMIFGSQRPCFSGVAVVEGHLPESGRGTVAEFLSFATAVGMPIKTGFLVLQKSVAKDSTFATISETNWLCDVDRLRPGL